LKDTRDYSKLSNHDQENLKLQFATKTNSASRNIEGDVYQTFETERPIKTMDRSMLSMDSTSNFLAE
jgi:hypothetical protein